MSEPVNPEGSVLLYRQGEFAKLDEGSWKTQVHTASARLEMRLRFMTDDHHRVRRFCVNELMRSGSPVSLRDIGKGVDLPPERVAAVVEELERNLFFVVRAGGTEVSWAFPVTVDETPHRLTFSTGERLYGAWAEDALAAPFVKGQLDGAEVSAELITQCAHCASELHIHLDQDLNHEVRSEGARPLYFEPSIDWTDFNEPNILHAYWSKCLFFWSEEHARAFLTAGESGDGALLTLDQGAYAMKWVMRALFAF